MKCPVCKDVTLLMSEKKGVEIDYCPECRGIWLDRGELEKLIEKEVTYNESHYERRETSRDERDYTREYDRDYERDHDRNRKYIKDDYYSDKYYDKKKYPRKKKRESFLEDIFDVFGD